MVVVIEAVMTFSLSVMPPGPGGLVFTGETRGEEETDRPGRIESRSLTRWSVDGRPGPRHHGTRFTPRLPKTGRSDSRRGGIDPKSRLPSMYIGYTEAQEALRKELRAY